MKIFIISLVLISVPICAYPQSPYSDNFNGEMAINNVIRLNNSSQQVAAAFGSPNQITYGHMEIEEKDLMIYRYSNGGTFYFSGNQLIFFKLTSANYQLYLGVFELKTGNNISSIQNLFPKSYSNRGADGTAITLGPPKDDYRYISIGTNSSGLITEIELRFIP